MISALNFREFIYIINIIQIFIIFCVLIIIYFYYVNNKNIFDKIEEINEDNEINEENEENEVNEVNEVEKEYIYIEYDIDYNNIRLENNEIIDNEIENLELNCNNFHDEYAIGMPFISEEMILIGTNIHSKIFFKNNYDELLDYCIETITSDPNWQRLEIIQIKHITIPGTIWSYSTCIIKTHYIKLIQRIWRKKLIDRKKLLESFHLIKLLKNREYNQNKIKI